MSAQPFPAEALQARERVLDVLKHGLRGARKQRRTGRTASLSCFPREAVEVSWKRATAAQRRKALYTTGPVVRALYDGNLKLLLATLVRQKLGAVPATREYELLERTEFLEVGDGALTLQDPVADSPTEALALLRRRLPHCLAWPRVLSPAERARVLGAGGVSSWEALEAVVGSLFEQAIVAVHAEAAGRAADASAARLLAEEVAEDATPAEGCEARKLKKKKKKKKKKQQRKKRNKRTSGWGSPTAGEGIATEEGRKESGRRLPVLSAGEGAAKSTVPAAELETPRATPEDAACPAVIAAGSDAGSIRSAASDATPPSVFTSSRPSVASVALGSPAERHATVSAAAAAPGTTAPRASLTSPRHRSPHPAATTTRCPSPTGGPAPARTRAAASPVPGAPSPGEGELHAPGSTARLQTPPRRLRAGGARAGRASPGASLVLRLSPSSSSSGCSSLSAWSPPASPSAASASPLPSPLPSPFPRAPAAGSPGWCDAFAPESAAGGLARAPPYAHAPWWDHRPAGISGPQTHQGLGANAGDVLRPGGLWGEQVVPSQFALRPSSAFAQRVAPHATAPVRDSVPSLGASGGRPHASTATTAPPPMSAATKARPAGPTRTRMRASAKAWVGAGAIAAEASRAVAGCVPSPAQERPKPLPRPPTREEVEANPAARRRWRRYTAALEAAFAQEMARGLAQAGAENAVAHWRASRALGYALRPDGLPSWAGETRRSAARRAKAAASANAGTGAAAGDAAAAAWFEEVLRSGQYSQEAWARGWVPPTGAAVVQQWGGSSAMAPRSVGAPHFLPFAAGHGPVQRFPPPAE